MIFKKSFLLSILTLLAFNVMITNKAFSQGVECAVFSSDTKGNLQLCEVAASINPELVATNPFVIAENNSLRVLLGKEIKPTIGGVDYNLHRDIFSPIFLMSFFGGFTYTHSNTGEIIEIRNIYDIFETGRISPDFDYLNTSMMYAQNDNPLTAYDARSFFIEGKKIDSWIRYSQTSGSQKETSSSDGFKFKSKAIATGLSGEMSKDLVVGVSINFSESDTRRVGVINENDLKRYGIIFNATKRFGPKYYIQGALGFTHVENSAIRVQTQNNNAVVTSDNNGQTYNASIGGGIKNAIKDFMVIPEVNLNYTNNHQEKFQEEGAGDFSLIVDSQDIEFLETEIVVNASYKGFNVGKKIIIPRVRIGYGYDLIGEDSVTNFTFVGAPGQVIRITNAKANRETITSSLALDIYGQDNMALKLSYINTKRDEFTSHTGSFSFNYQF